MTCELYRDRAKNWRWRLRARNGNILADSGQGYTRHLDCVRIATKLFPGAAVITRRGKAVPK